MQPEGTNYCSIAPNPVADAPRMEQSMKSISRSQSSDSQYLIGSGRGKCNCDNPDGGCKCNEPSMGRSSVSPYIYAIGRIEARFPRLGVEKEFVQATGRSDVVGLTDRDALRTILSKRENRYLVRQICWVFTIEGVDTYILKPSDPSDYDLLIESLRSSPRPTDIDVIIGHRGPIAPQDMCKGLAVPIVMLDQLYSFDIDGHIKALPKPEKIEGNKFKQAAEELLLRIMQMTDNTGGTDEHRALNYLAVRYHEIYRRTAEAFAANSSLTSVAVRPSSLSSVRKIFDVIFSFTNRQTDVVEKYFVRVDVTEEFPFLVTKMSPYYDL
jgi:hypothetical protein